MTPYRTPPIRVVLASAEISDVLARHVLRSRGAPFENGALLRIAMEGELGPDGLVSITLDIERAPPGAVPGPVAPLAIRSSGNARALEAQEHVLRLEIALREAIELVEDTHQTAANPNPCAAWRALLGESG